VFNTGVNPGPVLDWTGSAMNLWCFGVATLTPLLVVQAGAESNGFGGRTVGCRFGTPTSLADI